MSCTLLGRGEDVVRRVMDSGSVWFVDKFSRPFGLHLGYRALAKSGRQWLVWVFQLSGIVLYWEAVFARGGTPGVVNEWFGQVVFYVVSKFCRGTGVGGSLVGTFRGVIEVATMCIMLSVEIRLLGISYYLNGGPRHFYFTTACVGFAKCLFLAVIGFELDFFRREGGFGYFSTGWFAIFHRNSFTVTTGGWLFPWFFFRIRGLAKWEELEGVGVFYHTKGNFFSYRYGGMSWGS